MVAVVIALGVAVTSVAALALHLGRVFRSQKSVELRDDLASLKVSIVRDLSCDQTLPTQTCTPGNAVPLKTAGGTIFFNSSAGPQSFGTWKLKAYCNATGNGITVQSSRRNARNQPLKDPATGALQDWGNTYPSDLCQAAVGSCKWHWTVRGYSSLTGWAAVTQSDPGLTIAYEYFTPTGGGVGNPYLAGTVADKVPQAPVAGADTAMYIYNVACPANQVVRAGGCRSDYGNSWAEQRTNAAWGNSAWACAWDKVQGTAGAVTYAVDFIVDLLCCQL